MSLAGNEIVFEQCYFRLLSVCGAVLNKSFLLSFKGNFN